MTYRWLPLVPIAAVGLLVGALYYCGAISARPDAAVDPALPQLPSGDDEGAALWPPLPLKQGGEVLEIDGRTDIFQKTATGVRRLHGANLQPLWEVDLAAPLQQAGLHWRQPAEAEGEGENPWRLAHAAPDLDGDGRADLLWLSRAAPALFAQSGDDGEFIWAYRAGDEGFVDGEPLAFELNGQTVFLVTFWQGNHCWLDLLRGDTGKRLWRLELDPAWYGSPYECANPLGSLSKLKIEKFPMTVTRSGEKTLLSMMIVGTLIQLDAATGVAVGEPLPLDRPRPGQAAPQAGVTFGGAHCIGAVLRGQFVALTDNEVEDLLFLRWHVGGFDLVALSLVTRAILWETTLQDSPAWWFGALDWPLVYRDHGSTTILVHNGSTANQCVVEALDGKTGQARWKRRLPIDPQASGPSYRLDRFLPGPDLDGDGQQEVFVATLGLPHEHAGQPHHYLFVDALSGRDGHTLWSTCLRQPGPLPSAQEQPPTIPWLSWWNNGGDGWPRLLVPVRPAAGDTTTQPLTYVLSSGTGQVSQVLPGVANAHIADLDGDGVPDLYWYAAAETGRELHTLHGALPVAWRRLGHWRPVGDIDGDEITDYLGEDERLELGLLSGRDGRRLAIPPGMLPSLAVVVPLRLSAAPGDTNTLVGYRPNNQPRDAAFVALTWKQGKLDPLWLTNASEKIFDGRVAVPRSLALAGGSAKGHNAALLVLDCQLHFSGAPPNQDERWLIALNGGNGQLLWKHSLGTVTVDDSAELPPLPPTTFADMNLDGTPDVLAWALTNQQWELRFVNGRDGTTLWTRPFSFNERQRPAHTLPPIPLSFLGEQTGMTLLVLDAVKEESKAFVEVAALDPRTGQPKWTWRSTPGVTPAPDGQFPYALELDVRRPSVSFLVSTTGKSGALLQLDEQGQERKQIALEEVAAARLWPVYRESYPAAGLALTSVKGNGVVNQLLVLGGGLEPVTWPQPWLTATAPEIVAVASAHVNGPSLLVVKLDGWYHGVSATTGRLLWRTRSQPTLVPAASDRDPAHLLTQTDTATLCQLATPTPPQAPPRLGRPVPTYQERFALLVGQYHLDWLAFALLGAALVATAARRRWLLSTLVLLLPATTYVLLCWYSKRLPDVDLDPRVAEGELLPTLLSQSATLAAAVLLIGLLLFAVWLMLRRLVPLLSAKLRPSGGW